MLKKLAKYGNSTALVIDRAILELLNMDESSTVTDGKSLIITPASNLEKNKISYESFEALQQANHSYSEKQRATIESQLNHEKIMPQMQADFEDFFQKNIKVVTSVQKKIASSAEYKEAVEMLAKKYDPVTQSEEYLKELGDLTAKLVPEIAELQKGTTQIAKKYTDKAE